MKNAEKFRKIFKEFATEVWAFPEKDFLTWLNAEYEEPTTKNNLGVDLISRKQAIEEADKLCLETGYDNEKVIEMLEDLPSVTPQEPQTFKWCTDCKEYDQEKHCCHRWSKVIRDTVEEMKQEPRKGYWLHRPHVYGVTYCSVCDFELKIDNTNYCPHCGARMAETEAEDGNVDN